MDFLWANVTCIGSKFLAEAYNPEAYLFYCRGFLGDQSKLTFGYNEVTRMQRAAVYQQPILFIWMFYARSVKMF